MLGQMCVPVSVVGWLCFSMLMIYYWNEESELLVRWKAHSGQLSPPSPPPPSPPPPSPPPQFPPTQFPPPQFPPPASNVNEPYMKTLLLWTTWFGDHGHKHSPSWGIETFGYSWEDQKHTDLRDFGCDKDSYKCTITSDRLYLGDESLYDGIIFHYFDINQMDIPDKGKRGANQSYIYYTLEAPIQHSAWDPIKQPDINNNFFNATMTYSSDSEIHAPYGRIVKKTDHPTGEELDQYISDYGKRNERMLAGKQLSATIMISNCHSASGRENVLAELGKLMPVDVFGGCGKPVPDSKDEGNNIAGSDATRNLLGQTYPFYLAFENSLCEDYVSERFFDSLRANMIPVVMNGANMSRIAPKQSYIDLKEFASIRDLANYLEKVSADPALYASYFWWKDFYEVEYIRHWSRSFVKIFCEACRYLHTRKGTNVVEDLHKEWVEGRCSH